MWAINRNTCDRQIESQIVFEVFSQNFLKRFQAIWVKQFKITLDAN